MAEAPNRRSALDGHLHPGLYGAINGNDSPSIQMSERRDLNIVQVACWQPAPKEVLSVLSRFCSGDVTTNSQQATGSGDIRVCWISDQRWLLVSEGSPSLLGEVTSALAGQPAAVTDLSHARTVIRLQGPAARLLLAKGSSVDFHPAVFQPDETRAVSMGHFNALIDCQGEDVFDVYFMRSFAVSAWEWLVKAAEPEGFEVSC